MTSETDIAISFAVLGFVLFLLVILWQKKYFALVFMRMKNKSLGHHVRIWHKDGSYTDYLVPNVRTFDWKKKPWAKIFDALPEWLDSVQIPSTPYARDRRTGFASYEFNEDSKECINPYKRQPVLDLYELEQNTLKNAFELGRKWEQLKQGPKVNMLIVALLCLNLLVATIGVVFINNMATSIKDIQDNQITPGLAKIDKAILDVQEGRTIVRTYSTPANPPPNSGGQVGQVG